MLHSTRPSTQRQHRCPPPTGMLLSHGIMMPRHAATCLRIMARWLGNMTATPPRPPAGTSFRQLMRHGPLHRAHDFPLVTSHRPRRTYGTYGMGDAICAPAPIRRTRTPHASGCPGALLALCRPIRMLHPPCSVRCPYARMRCPCACYTPDDGMNSAWTAFPHPSTPPPHHVTVNVNDLLAISI